MSKRPNTLKYVPKPVVVKEEVVEDEGLLSAAAYVPPISCYYMPTCVAYYFILPAPLQPPPYAPTNLTSLETS
jgi:hypothetical protein